MPGARKGESGLRALPPPRGLTALFHSAFWLEAENGSRAPPVGQDCDGQPGFVILGVGRCRCGYQPMKQPQMCGARRGRSQSRGHGGAPAARERSSWDSDKCVVCDGTERDAAVTARTDRLGNTRQRFSHDAEEKAGGTWRKFLRDRRVAAASARNQTPFPLAPAGST